MICILEKYQNIVEYGLINSFWPLTSTHIFFLHSLVTVSSFTACMTFLNRRPKNIYIPAEVHNNLCVALKQHGNYYWISLLNISNAAVTTPSQNLTGKSIYFFCFLEIFTQTEILQDMKKASNAPVI